MTYRDKKAVTVFYEDGRSETYRNVWECSYEQESDNFLILMFLPAKVGAAVPEKSIHVEFAGVVGWEILPEGHDGAVLTPEVVKVPRRWWSRKT